jgi:hypothetical protein
MLTAFFQNKNGLKEEKKKRRKEEKKKKSLID